MTDELSKRRVDKAIDNKTVSPVDLLRAMADDIESGRLKVDGLLLLYCWRPSEGVWDYGGYRCGLTYDQQLVMVDLAHERIIRQWIRK